MEKQTKKAELKSVKVSTNIYSKIKDLQNTLQKENDYEKHVSYSKVLEILLSSYELKN
jgi:hypothetical protein